MIDRRMRTTAICTVLFAAVTLAVCLWRSATKPLGAARAEEQVPWARLQISAEPAPSQQWPRMLVLDAPTGDGAGDLILRFPEGAEPGEIRAETQYLGPRQLSVAIPGAEPYLSELLDGIQVNGDKVLSGTCSLGRDGVARLVFALDGLYEPALHVTEGEARISLAVPQERYDKRVVVAPLGPEAAGEDVTLRAARAFSEQYREAGDAGVYLTREAGSAAQASPEELLRETSGQLCVVLRQEPAEEGIPGLTLVASYDDAIFLRRYTNARFARELLLGITGQGGVSSVKLIPTRLPELFREDARVPAAVLTLRLDEKAWDAASLEACCARLARGMAEAADRAFEEME